MRDYNGAPINYFGETSLNVTFSCKCFTHKFLVVSNDKENLLGRDLCKKLDVKLIFPDKINSINTLSEFQDYLSDSFESNVTDTVHLEVKESATPIYCKPRQVPVKLREKLKSELSRLEENGKITKIFDSKWASPIVTVFKSDGSLRLCGDFSSTVNKHLDPVQTPLPTVDETIARVCKATLFSKVDMSEAFLQLPLDEVSKQYTVINTPEGLYQFNYLPFGLTASSGIFQSFLSRTLSQIEDVIIYQDDILILSKDIESHHNTIRAVLNSLKDKGLKIKSAKCQFLCDSIEYLGHVFDKSGVHPNPNKLRSILDAPNPKDVKQVQAFLGLCSYYAWFIPNFAQTMSLSTAPKECNLCLGSNPTKLF